MIIAIPREIKVGENRVAIVPDVVKKLIKLGYEVNVEKNAGLISSFTDEMYVKAGAKIVESVEKLYADADIVMKVQKPQYNEVLGKVELEMMKAGAYLIAFAYPLLNIDFIKKCAEHKVNVISMDQIPRTTRAQKMDALSSQSNLAGYKTVIMAADELGKIFPLMMTAAGTVSPAKVVIMGAGVAGLQALGTARRLGAVVEVSDIRPQVKDEVRSLGGRFIEVPVDKSMQDKGGYAKEASDEFLSKQKELIFKHITDADIVITTALIPGKRAPVLVTEEMIQNMRQGSVIIDMAVEFGGNCELSVLGKRVEKHGVKIIGEPNIPSLVPVHASELYANNLLNLITYISKNGAIKLDFQDEIVREAVITFNGEVVQQRTKELL